MSDEPRDQSREPGTPEDPVSSEERPAETPAEAGEPDAAAPEEATAPVVPRDVAEGGADEGSQEPAAGGEDDEAAAREEAAAKEKEAAQAQAKAEAAAKKKAAHEAAEAAKEPWERDPKVPEWEDAADDALAQALREKHPEAIESTRKFAGDLTIEVRREDIQQVCATLKDDQGFLLPVDVCGAHYPDRESGQFEVVYHLYSFEKNRRIRVKTRTDEGVEVPSVSSVWRGTNWPEREAYDMYGIRFSGHPDMTRILLWEGFNGFPLRKDFPVEGIDTGSAIYPEYYEDEAGPVAGTGTGWKPPEPPEPEPEADVEAEEGSEDPSA